MDPIPNQNETALRWCMDWLIPPAVALLRTQW